MPVGRARPVTCATRRRREGLNMSTVPAAACAITKWPLAKATESNPGRPGKSMIAICLSCALAARLARSIRIGIRIRERIDYFLDESRPDVACYAGQDWDATELLAVGL